MNSYNDALRYLISWCRGRYEWMMEYYFPVEIEIQDDDTSEEVTVSDQT